MSDAASMTLANSNVAYFSGLGLSPGLLPQTAQAKIGAPCITPRNTTQPNGPLGLTNLNIINEKA
jgi:hypothetical protein